MLCLSVDLFYIKSEPITIKIGLSISSMLWSATDYTNVITKLHLETEKKFSEDS